MSKKPAITHMSASFPTVSISKVTQSLLLLGLYSLSLPAMADTYAPWLTQIGITDKIMSAANWGRGLYLGVVDTGISTSASAFATGQISSSLSSCAAKTFSCSNGFQDDNGHGTAVAEIAAGNAKYAYASNYGGYKVTAGSVVSVAPNANIIAEKVLNASGSGYSTDVANGIKKAADAGAAVINVSITYGNTSDLVAAINYAAAKGAMIVWAGGNSAINLLNGANTTGLTAAAIQRLIFVGSVNASNVVSSFSNKPGSGSLVAGTTRTSYQSRWLMAPGEAILASYITGGSSSWAYWSGTSMSAPMVSGSLILLESAWPILRTNGTAANLLLATTTDLGTTGVDSTYGNGLMSMTKAFQPYGSLTVTGTNGKTYTVSSLTSSLLTGGALGSLTSLQSVLSNYTAFDGYSRNFTVNLSSLVSSSTGTATLNPLPTNTNTGPAVVKLAGGNTFAYWQEDVDLRPTAAVFWAGGDANTTLRQGYAAMRLADGTQFAAGTGYAPQYAHQSALYDMGDMARLSLDMGNTDLHSLAQGGLLTSIGLPLGQGNRLAVSWSQTGERNPLVSTLTANASQLSVGWSHQFNPAWTGAVSYSNLQEQQGFLGSVFSSDSMLGLHGNTTSQSVDFSSVYQLDHRHALMAQMSVATTDAVQGDGMLTGSSRLNSQGFGVGFLSKQVWNKEDQLALTLKQPLRLNAGTMGVLTAGVDELGQAVYQVQKVSLVPDGRELDLKLSYDTPLSALQTLRLQAIYRHDVLHVQGDNDFSIGGTFQLKF